MKKQRIFITAVLLLAALWGAPRRAAAQIFAVRANALAVCSATLNAGAEAALTDNWSLELSGYWNPVKTASLSMNFHAVQLGGRYWFYESFVGHFLGQHLTYVGYDLGSRTKRYKGHACGLGVSYGYAWMLSKRWNVAVEAGAFRTDKNIKLATYASRCIENEILMYLRKNSSQRTEVSFDEPLNTDWDGKELLLSDVLGTEGDVVMRPIEEDVDRQLLQTAVSHLSPRERDIITMRFGLGGAKELTQKEVADRLGISQSYISRLEKRIILRLRRDLQKMS